MLIFVIMRSHLYFLYIFIPIENLTYKSLITDVEIESS